VTWGVIRVNRLNWKSTREKGEIVSMKSMKTLKMILAACLLRLLRLPLPRAHAWRSGVDKSRHQIQKKAIVAKNMQMDDAIAEKFWPLYNSYQDAMSKTNDRASALLNDFAANWMDLSDEKAKSLLNDFFRLKADQLRWRNPSRKNFPGHCRPKWWPGFSRLTTNWTLSWPPNWHKDSLWFIKFDVLICSSFDSIKEPNPWNYPDNWCPC